MREQFQETCASVASSLHDRVCCGSTVVSHFDCTKSTCRESLLIYRRSGIFHVKTFFTRQFFTELNFRWVRAIHENLSPGSYHCNEYGRAWWLVASAFIVKSGRQLLQKYSCERAMAVKDGHALWQ